MTPLWRLEVANGCFMTLQFVKSEQYYDLLDAAMTARDANQDATEVLKASANAYGYSPQAIVGLWTAARIAER